MMVCSFALILSVGANTLYAQHVKESQNSTTKTSYSSFNAFLKSEFVPIDSYSLVGEIYLLETRFIEFNYQRIYPLRSRWDVGYRLGLNASYRGYSDLKFNVASYNGAIIIRRKTKESILGFGYMQAKSGLIWNNSILYVDPLRFKSLELEVGSQLGWMFLDEDRNGLNVEFGPRWGFGLRGHILTYQLSLGVALGGKNR